MEWREGLRGDRTEVVHKFECFVVILYVRRLS